MSIRTFPDLDVWELLSQRSLMFCDTQPPQFSIRLYRPSGSWQFSISRKTKEQKKLNRKYGRFPKMLYRDKWSAFWEFLNPRRPLIGSTCKHSLISQLSYRIERVSYDKFLILGLHFAKRNREHCNVAEIMYLILAWKKNLIIHLQFLFYSLKNCKFKTKIAMKINYFFKISVILLQRMKMHNLSIIAMLMVPLCKMQST